MNSILEAWEAMCDYIRTQITEVAFKTWFSRIKPASLDFDLGKLVLIVPNDFHLQTINRCYLELLDDSVKQIFGKKISIKLTTEKNKLKEITESKKSDFNDIRYEFTFENFIVGSSNRFVHAASLAVATNPAHAYNPLFIYGNSGLGKTHMLYAIMNEIQKNNSNMNMIYIKGDDFTNELIDAIRNGQTFEFREKYRKTDLLLVDDIQFIGGKDSTQEEFFHTFNTLYESHKQIVMTSDRPPKEIRTLEDRLRSRFEWGLIADIQPPDFETRIAIIKRKAELLNFDIPNDICEYIAVKIKSNIRQLEGTVKNLKGNSLLNGEKLTIINTQAAISKMLNTERPATITIEKIIGEVSRTMNVTEKDIRSSKRSANISSARQISMYIAREITNLSMNAIGEEFGGRDHSTVVYAIHQTENNIKKNNDIKFLVEDIIKNIRNL